MEKTYPASWFCSAPEDKRIYCVVAQTVQSPLIEETILTPATKRSTKVCSIEGTKTIVQPAGRLIAQAAHVVSKTRVLMLLTLLKNVFKNLLSRKASIKALGEFIEAWTFEPVTTIILSARDSYELYHVLNLLYKAGVEVHSFYDYNQPDYGNPKWKVMTAIATEPVNPEKVVGILDYLPLALSQ